MGFRTSLLAGLAIALWPSLLVRQAAPQVAAVLFVGCNSDGQVGPLPAPNAPDRVVRVDVSVAGRLAYYKAEKGPGVLGPRGWSCVGIYGSGGSSLSVAPSLPNAESLFSSTPGLAGPVIELGVHDGGTSGRFEVGRIAARVFPLERDFVRRLNVEREPAIPFPFGPYPADRLVYRGDRVVEYETPPDSEGLGTIGRLQKSNDSTRGVAILKGTDPDLWLLSMRLPTGMSDLATPIIRQVEQEP